MTCKVVTVDTTHYEDIGGCGGMIPSILTTALDGSEWSVSIQRRPGWLGSRENPVASARNQTTIPWSSSP